MKYPDITKMKVVRFPRITANIAPSFCRDDCMATYATYANIDFERIYLSTLKNGFFDFQKNPVIGKCFKSEFDLTNAAKEFLGISINKYEDEFETAIAIMKEKVKQNIPVCISIQGYWCPWDWRYQEIEEGLHSFFLVEYDESKDLFQCIDPYYEKENVSLSVDDMRKGYVCYEEFVKDPSFESMEPIDLLKENLQSLLEEGWIDSLKELGEQIKSSFDTSLEIEGIDEIEDYTMDEIHERIYLNNALKIMVHNILRFSIFMYKMDEWYPEYENAFRMLADEMKLISEKWEMVRFMLLKLVFSNDFNAIANALSRRIFTIAEQEMQLVQKIVDVINKKYKVEKTSIDTDTKEGELICIDLSKFFNNKGIGSEKNMNADFNGIGEYFISDSMPTDHEISSFDIRFLINDDTNRMYDNISCARQTISIQKDYYVAFCILGCSEWGAFKEYFKVRYEDGSYENVLVELNDWVPEINRTVDHTLAIKCEKTIMDEEESFDSKENCYLYASKHNISSSKRLTEIEFPECMNMHVFSLSLIKLNK